MTIRSLVALSVLVLVLALLSLVPRQASTSRGELDVRRAHVEDLLAEKDTRHAYESFKANVAELSEDEQHLFAHVFGEVLYEQGDLSAFVVCDGEFGFGCFHGFIGAALAEHGTEILRDLDEACVSAFGTMGTGCFHGLGHGLVSYFGYEIADVKRSLTLCQTLSWQKPMSGCSDGVFMEYNFRTMEKDPALRYRPYADSERFEPCTSITLYPIACYFSLPAWWASALPTTSGLSSTLAAFCNEIRSEREKTACFRGMGYGIMPTLSFAVADATLFCDAAEGMPRIWCREGIAWALFSDPLTRADTERACTLRLDKKEAALCLSEYQFAVNEL